jgi:hypothetical protein
VDVINRGFSGYNTKWALKIFDEVVLNLKPNFVIIFFGANDAAIESSSQFVSLALYEQNLSNFIQRIKEVKSSPLLVSADLSVSLSRLVSSVDSSRHSHSLGDPTAHPRDQAAGLSVHRASGDPSHLSNRTSIVKKAKAMSSIEGMKGRWPTLPPPSPLPPSAPHCPVTEPLSM